MVKKEKEGHYEDEQLIEGKRKQEKRGWEEINTDGERLIGRRQEK